MILNTMDCSNSNNDNSYKIGDVLFTKRTDIGDNWLLCDGSEVNVSEYNDLANTTTNFASYISGSNGIHSLTLPSSFICKFIKYLNGYWVIGGSAYNSSSETDYGVICYATSLSGTWTIIKPDAEPTDIEYANGYWAISCKGSTGSYYCFVKYATSLSGTWTTVTVKQSDKAGNTTLNCIKYVNGYWIVGGSYYNSDKGYYYSLVAKTTDITSDSGWSYVGLSGCNNYSYANCIEYLGEYLMVGIYTNSSGSEYGRISYLRPNDTIWSSSSDFTTTAIAKSNVGILSIDYDGTYWVAGGSTYKSGTGIDIYYTTDPASGSWTTQTLMIGNSNQTYDSSCINSVVYANGYWAVSGTAYDSSNYPVWYTAAGNPTTGWTENTKSGAGNDRNNLCFYDNFWVWSTNGTSSTIYYTTPTTFILPSIDLEVPAYIKAK